MTGFETSSERRPRATLNQAGYGLIPIKLRGPGLQLAVRCGSTTYLCEADSLGPRGPRSGPQANPPHQPGHRRDNLKPYGGFRGREAIVGIPTCHLR